MNTQVTQTWTLISSLMANVYCIENLDTTEFSPTKHCVHLWLDSVLQHPNISTQNTQPIEIDICYFPAAQMQALNQRYRGKNSATNILSFPADVQYPTSSGTTLLGDMAICSAIVNREALEQGKDTLAHWAHIFIHGCLHLLGYDHINDSDAIAMESLETQIITKLGFNPPYSDQP